MESARRVAVDNNFREFDAPTWTGGSADWQDADYTDQHPVDIGKLYWPRGASRWAVGHFVIDEGTLKKVRPHAYASSGPVALPLIIDDGTDSITTDLYMLPPRPLFKLDGTGDQNLYLLSLVDERYWWWNKTAEITITGGTTTWANLYSSIGSALGVTIDADPVSSDYLKPPTELKSRYDFMPLLLDAVAYSVGQRIVRKLDGTVEAWGPSTAAGVRDDLWTDWHEYSMMGGDFRFSPDEPNVDLATLVPGTVRMTFPRKKTNATSVDGYEPYTKTLTSLALDEYTSVVAKSDTKTVRSTATAAIDSGGSVTNVTELQALADAFASDWYLWSAAGDQFRLMTGTVPWDGDATVDFVEWEAYPTMSTMVARDRLNDLASRVFHRSSSGSLGDPLACCGGTYTWTNIDYAYGAGSHYQLSEWESTNADTTSGSVYIDLPENPTSNAECAVSVYPPGSGYSAWVFTTDGATICRAASTGDFLAVGGSIGGPVRWVFKYDASNDNWWPSLPLNTGT
jgi:hypothetical protein